MRSSTRPCSPSDSWPRNAALPLRSSPSQCSSTHARTAEFVKLAENAYRDVNIAFANELSAICDEMKLDPWEAIELANRHPRVNILRPGAGVGGHCIPVDPFYLSWKAREYDFYTRFIEHAAAINESTVNAML